MNRRGAGLDRGPPAIRPRWGRITVRRLMIVVAVAALASGAELWRRRIPYCRGKAGRCDLIERSHLGAADGHARIAALYRRRAAEGRGSARFNHEEAAFFARAERVERAAGRRAADRAEAYRRAALYPWLAVPPDEPEPPGLASGAIEARERRPATAKPPPP